MAQKTGQEETEFESVQEICVNDCGVAVSGNPSSNNNNMCQTCFKFTAKIHRSAILLRRHAPSETTTATTPDPAVKKVVVNRCSGCKRRVGLTGFRCRCGEMFCSDHRYSDRHDCGYDYKAAGREAIAKENPVVRAAKLIKV